MMKVDWKGEELTLVRLEKNILPAVSSSSSKMVAKSLRIPDTLHLRQPNRLNSEDLMELLPSFFDVFSFRELQIEGEIDPKIIEKKIMDDISFETKGTITTVKTINYILKKIMDSVSGYTSQDDSTIQF